MHPDSAVYQDEAKSRNWNYEQGVLFESLLRLWKQTRDTAFFEYVQRNLDYYIKEGGTIATYEMNDFSLDNISEGRPALRLFELSGKMKYRLAADTLRKQLALQPRTGDGGFWHKKIYPFQMWLDGIFMAEPFFAYYAAVANEPEDFDEIARQILLMDRHTRDTATGLLYHGWDEKRAQAWADKTTGCSPTFWSRSMGWYVMGILDVLDWFPAGHPQRPALVAAFRRAVTAVYQYRDPGTKLWFQVIDQPSRHGNFLESSAACMFIYAAAKGANRGYLDDSMRYKAQESFSALTKHFITTDDRGFLSLHEVCQGAGLGGVPYRDGSFEYYVNEPRRTNDFKGIGPFIFAALELEQGPQQKRSK